jgi:hypothetical protein
VLPAEAHSLLLTSHNVLHSAGMISGFRPPDAELFRLCEVGVRSAHRLSYNMGVRSLIASQRVQPPRRMSYLVN